MRSPWITGERSKVVTDVLTKEEEVGHRGQDWREMATSQELSEPPDSGGGQKAFSASSPPAETRLGGAENQTAWEADS